VTVVVAAASQIGDAVKIQEARDFYGLLFLILTMIDTKYFLIPAISKLKTEVIELLRENNLPTEDLDDDKKLFALIGENGIIGTGGLEFFEDCALLRSVGVRENFRGAGYGKIIALELELLCREKNIDSIYLLTETAKDFFEKLGYEMVDRETVPDAIKNSSEFSTICPSSATVMKKFLA
jgi:amino-acid N-acetyltransferase